jgi:hypothetical protein
MAVPYTHRIMFHRTGSPTCRKVSREPVKQHATAAAWFAIVSAHQLKLIYRPTSKVPEPCSNLSCASASIEVADLEDKCRRCARSVTLHDNRPDNLRANGPGQSRGEVETTRLAGSAQLPPCKADLNRGSARSGSDKQTRPRHTSQRCSPTHGTITANTVKE